MYGNKILSANGWETVENKKYSVSVGLYEKEGKYNYHERWHKGMGPYDDEHSKIETNLTKEEAMNRIVNLRNRRFFCEPSYLKPKYGVQWVIDTWFHN